MKLVRVHQNRKNVLFLSDMLMLKVNGILNDLFLKIGATHFQLKIGENAVLRPLLT